MPPRKKKRKKQKTEIDWTLRRYRMLVDVEIDDELKEIEEAQDLSDQDYIARELGMCEFLQARVLLFEENHDLHPEVNWRGKEKKWAVPVEMPKVSETPKAEKTWVEDLLYGSWKPDESHPPLDPPLV